MPFSMIALVLLKSRKIHTFLDYTSFTSMGKEEGYWMNVTSSESLSKVKEVSFNWKKNFEYCMLI